MTDFVTAAELALMRAETEGTMTSLATIERYTETVVAGSSKRTYTSHLTNVRCRLSVATHRPATEIPAIPKEGVRSITYWILRFPYGTDVKEKDRVIIDGKTYELVGVQAVRSMDTVVRCMAVRLTNA